MVCPPPPDWSIDESGLWFYLETNLYCFLKIYYLTHNVILSPHILSVAYNQYRLLSFKHKWFYLTVIQLPCIQQYQRII